MCTLLEVWETHLGGGDEHNFGESASSPTSRLFLETRSHWVAQPGTHYVYQTPLMHTASLLFLASYMGLQV